MKATSTTSSSRSTTSHLLNTELSEHVVAETLTFLDRSSVANLMKVTRVRDRFHLADYYCRDHGTKLESKEVVAAATVSATAMAAMDSGNDDQSDEENDQEQQQPPYYKIRRHGGKSPGRR